MDWRQIISQTATNERWPVKGALWDEKVRVWPCLLQEWLLSPHWPALGLRMIRICNASQCISHELRLWTPQWRGFGYLLMGFPCVLLQTIDITICQAKREKMMPHREDIVSLLKLKVITEVTKNGESSSGSDLLDGFWYSRCSIICGCDWVYMYIVLTVYSMLLNSTVQLYYSAK